MTALVVGIVLTARVLARAWREHAH